MVISRFNEAGHGAQHATVKELHTDKYKLYCLSFAESSVDSKWDKVIFTDESTFSSANYGLVLFYRPWGKHCISQYMSTSTCSGLVSVHWWGWISHEGAGMLYHIEGHLDSRQFKHILQNIMVLFVRMFYPIGIIQFHQDVYSMILVWFKNGCHCRLTSNHEHLILTPSRICGVRWRGQCRKCGLSSFPEIVLSYGPLCQMLRMKLLRHSVMFDHWLSPW